MLVFKRLRGQVGAVWAPKCRLEAVWTVKTATDRVSREVGTAKSLQNLARQFGLAVGVMEIVENCRKSSQTRIRARSKVYLTHKSYD